MTTDCVLTNIEVTWSLLEVRSSVSVGGLLRFFINTKKKCNFCHRL